MRPSIKKGFSFGLTSGVITTLGLMVGLNASTRSTLVVIGGILTIAIADSFSDALGIHISEESIEGIKTRDVWESTVATFLSKFVFALTFVIPILLLPLSTAVIVSVVWGLFLISIISFYIAKQNNIKPHKMIIEHLAIAVLVIFITHYVGTWISVVFA